MKNKNLFSCLLQIHFCNKMVLLKEISEGIWGKKRKEISFHMLIDPEGQKLNIWEFGSRTRSS
jgi:hypothetical protein